MLVFFVNIGTISYLKKKKGLLMNAVVTPGFVYDAASILGLGAESAAPLPPAENEQFVINYDGWSSRDIFSSPYRRVFQQIVWFRNPCADWSWIEETLPKGIYRLNRIEALGTGFAHFRGPSGPTTLAPPVLAITTMLTYRLKTGTALFENECLRLGQGSTTIGLYWRSRYSPLYIDNNARSFDASPWFSYERID